MLFTGAGRLCLFFSRKRRTRMVSGILGSDGMVPPARPAPTPGGYQKCEKFWTLPCTAKGVKAFGTPIKD